MTSLLPVPLAPSAPERAAEIASLKDRIIQAIRKTDDPVWGSEGDFQSANVTVDRRLLWTMPLYPITWNQDELKNVGRSIATQGQRKPITVAAYADPRRREEDG